MPTTRALQGAIRDAVRVGRAGRSRVTETAKVPRWTTLVVRDARGHELGTVERIEALAEWRATGGMRNAWFDYRGEEHEDPDDASTWGPCTAHDVEWRGFPALQWEPRGRD